MKKTLTVDLPGRSYEIEIERGLLSSVGLRCKELLPKAQRLFVVTDQTVYDLYGAQVNTSLQNAGFAAHISVVPAGESSKSTEHLVALWEEMMSFGLTRTDAVIALGGGVVGDLAGFAAATILRGVAYIQIPTTLLSQVDSSVGGKVAVDLQAGKNLAGAFWQPKAVFIDPNVLQTLSDATFSDGMAEVIKYGCIGNADFFSFLAQCGGRSGVMAHIEEVIYTCCDQKRQVVLQDERDTGLRMTLNFGHTIGHAFELAGHYVTYTHGQGVAAGMCCAIDLGIALGITPKEIKPMVTSILEQYHLPTQIPCSWSILEEAVGLDKKRSGNQITLILLEQLGHAIPYSMKKEQLLELLAPTFRR